MKYDFDAIHSRKNTSCVKWNYSDDTIPMWIADMDFKTAPCIIDAITNKANEGIYGYEDFDDEWYNAYINWWGKYHHLSFAKENMCFSTGIIPIISSSVRKLTSPGENVLIQTPVYNVFTNSIVNAGRNVIENRLIKKDNEFFIDFEDLEKKLSNPQTTLMILCNPHNPVSKIWDKETLEKIGKLCKENYVTVISDEIHCDISRPGKEYVPFASVNELNRDISVTCISPTKCFSIAGIQTSACVVFNEGLKNKVFKALNSDEVAYGNCFSYRASTAAFNYGKEWLDQMNEYVFENRDIVSSFLKENLSSVHVTKGDATYLLWLDLSELLDDTKDLCDYLKNESHVHVTYGGVYGENGKSYIRMNVATPKSILNEGLKRFVSGVKSYVKK